MWVATAENAQSFYPLDVCKKERKSGVYTYVGAETRPTTGGMALSVRKPAECSNQCKGVLSYKRPKECAAAPAEGGHSRRRAADGHIDYRNRGQEAARKSAPRLLTTRKPHGDYHWRPKKSSTYLRIPDGVCLKWSLPCRGLGRRLRGGVGRDAWLLGFGKKRGAVSGGPLAHMLQRPFTSSRRRIPASF